MNGIKNQWEIIKISFISNKIHCSLYILIRVITSLIPAFYVLDYSEFIDNILKFYSGYVTYRALLYPFLGISFITFLKYLCESVEGYISNKMYLNLLKTLKVKMIEKRAKLKYELIENKDIWDLIYRTSKGIPDKISIGFISLFDLLELFINIISTIIIIGMFSKIVAVIVFLSFIPIVIVSIKSGKNDYSGYKEIEKIHRRIESYESILISKEYVDERTIFNYTKFFSEKCKSAYNAMISMFLKIKLRFYKKVKITSFIITIIILGIIFILMNLAVNKTITIGLFTSIVMELLGIINSIAWRLASIVYKLINSNVYMKDYLTFYSLEEISADTLNSQCIDHINNIEFKNVSFKYPGNTEYTLKNLNMKINNNENCAIVGENGAGKSTLIKLLLKLYDNYEGQILINGIELRKVKDVTSLFSVVFQDYSKYEISIKDNLTFGDNKISEEKLFQYFNYVNFPMIKEKFNNGIYTELGRLTNINTDMSIGQWQKLAMVRALCEKGNFYILDEPTAALDPITETIVYRDFMKILRKNPSLIITHRLGAAKLADKIIVIKDGTNVETGSHEELMEKDSIYKRMYESQSRWYNDEKSEYIKSDL